MAPETNDIIFLYLNRSTWTAGEFFLTQNWFKILWDYPFKALNRTSNSKRIRTKSATETDLKLPSTFYLYYSTVLWFIGTLFFLNPILSNTGIVTGNVICRLTGYFWHRLLLNLIQVVVRADSDPPKIQNCNRWAARRRINTEEKAKVVAAVWGTECKKIMFRYQYSIPCCAVR